MSVTKIKSMNLKEELMKRMLRKCIVTTMALVMILTMNVLAFDTGTGQVTVPTGSNFVVAKRKIKRSKKYDYAIVKANSVSPVEEGKKDTYTRCKTRLHYGDTPISSIVVLEENKLTHVNIYNGHLNHSTFNVRFAGNDPKLGARISYYYNGK